ncbi:hypothetical protein [Natronolimnobius baerhuensis]|uniref:Uncharacterized protein n=1 Tax=Natronolimnobius baerhuensis TaxID=253108 RepID=A0A202E4X2_9EURY|nr:hypothetical protein [Natronolimnobius baerhuensis]OVE83264.1 hypothetical protein B2G88_17865 [Natronolimnobius baerhuensis]
MTNATADSNEGGLFDSTFSIGAVAVAVVFVLIGLLMAWTGYQDDELLLVGTEMSIISGMAGLMVTWFAGLVAFVIAVYMEPGFDQ